MERLSCEEVEQALVALTLNPRELGETERAAIAVGINECAGCRELYEDYVRISQGLMYAAPVRVPPPALKAGLMAAIQAQDAAQNTAAQRPPVSQVQAPARSSTQAPMQAPSRQVGQAASNKRMAQKRGLLERLGDWLTGSARVPRMGFGLATVLLAVAAGVMFTQLQGRIAAQNAQLARQQAELTQQQQQVAEQQQVLAILADAGGNSVSLNSQAAAPNAVARIQFNPAGSIAVLSVDGLPTLQASQQYQLWLFDATGKPLPSNTFDATAKNVVVNAQAKFGGFINFAVSVEPKGGSQAPTGPLALLANS